MTFIKTDNDIYHFLIASNFYLNERLWWESKLYITNNQLILPLQEFRRRSRSTCAELFVESSCEMKLVVSSELHKEGEIFEWNI